MLVSLSQRQNIDERTLGEIFFYITKELEDISLGAALILITETIFESLFECIYLDNAQVNDIIKNFVSKLPQYMKDAITAAA